MRWSATILGEPCSKANSRRLVSFGGRPRVIKSKKALDYSEAVLAQLAFLRPARPIEGDVIATIRIWYASRRPDLDDSLVLDLLQKGAVIVNDRQVKERHVYWMGVDKARPRAEIEIETREV